METGGVALAEAPERQAGHPERRRGNQRTRRRGDLQLGLGGTRPITACGVAWYTSGESFSPASTSRSWRNYSEVAISSSGAR